MNRTLNTVLVPALAVAVLAGCTKRVHEQPIMTNGDRVPSVDGASVAGAEDTRRDQAAAAERRDELTGHALATCEPIICEAIARGEVSLGMSEAQVLAATRTTESAWSTRHGGGAAMMVPRQMATAPSDMVGELAMVQLRDGRVTGYSYRESQGLRLVSRPEDATTAGSAAGRAEQLVRQGDQRAAAGDLDGALDLYDRADVLSRGSAELDYRIATVLDKQLRPIEALIRYQLFLHRLEIEKIQARGEASARLAEAIALAQQRIIVLERQAR